MNKFEKPDSAVETRGSSQREALTGAKKTIQDLADERMRGANDRLLGIDRTIQRDLISERRLHAKDEPGVEQVRRLYRIRKDNRAIALRAMSEAFMVSEGLDAIEAGIRPSTEFLAMLETQEKDAAEELSRDHAAFERAEPERVMPSRRHLEEIAALRAHAESLPPEGQE